MRPRNGYLLIQGRIKAIEFSKNLFPTLRERALECEEKRDVPDRTIEDLVMFHSARINNDNATIYVSLL